VFRVKPDREAHHGLRHHDRSRPGPFRPGRGWHHHRRAERRSWHRLRPSAARAASRPAPPGSSRLVIDLPKVSHCDASGLAVLIGTGRRAGLLGGFLRLPQFQRRRDQGLHITGLRQHLGVFPTVQGATASPQGPRGKEDSATAVYAIHSPVRVEDGPQAGRV